MPPKLLTINAVSAPRRRDQQKSSTIPIPAQQRKEKIAARQERQRQIDDAVSDWYSYTLAKADELGKTFDKKPRYFLDIFFQGGAKMVNHRHKTNSYNAFKSLKAAELSEEGNPTRLGIIQQEYHNEYEALSPEEKAELIEEFDTHKQEGLKMCRPTARARIQDVANVARNIQLLMMGLTYRAGIEGFFCIVRNSPEYHMKPQWFFTSPALEEYMHIAVRKKWDTSEIGAKLEAFAVAGCDVVNLLRTSKQKADHLKREIRQKISEMLIDVTGNPSAMMQYTNYEEAIVHRYGIELRGWTYEKFVNPSELSTAIGPLRNLLNAITNGDCYFEKLTPEQRRKCRETYEAKIAAGEITVRKRKTRSDYGTKKKGKAMGGAADDDDDEESDDSDDLHWGRSKKRQRTAARSASTISNSDSE